MHQTEFFICGECHLECHTFNSTLDCRLKSLISFYFLDHLDCYIQSFSEVRKGPQKDYFFCQLQTKDKGNVSGVCFSPKKLKEKIDNIAENKSPVKIKNFKVNDKFGVKIVIDDADIEDLPEQSEFIAAPTVDNQQSVPISMLSKITLGQTLNVKGQIAQLSPVKLQIMDDLSQVKKQESILYDSSGSIKFTLWGKHVDTVELNKTYHIKNVRVRKDKFGEIFINSIKSGQTSIEEIPPFTEELAQITTTLENPSVTEGKMNVVAIQSFTRSLVCLSCRKRAVPTKSGKSAICENKSCRAIQKLSACGTTYYMKIYLQPVENPSQKFLLTAYDHIVRKLESQCPIAFSLCSDEEIIEAILELNELDITFDNIENKILNVHQVTTYDI